MLRKKVVYPPAELDPRDGDLRLPNEVVAQLGLAKGLKDARKLLKKLEKHRARFLVLFDEPCAVGALVAVRLIGVIEAEQTEAGKTVRNDRLLSVGCVSHLYAKVGEPGDLGRDYLDHLTQFWVQYNDLKGKRFEVLAVRGPKAAIDAVRKGSVA